jgi:hypothetical protein
VPAVAIWATEIPPIKPLGRGFPEVSDCGFAFSKSWRCAKDLRAELSIRGYAERYKYYLVWFYEVREVLILVDVSRCIDGVCGRGA